MKYTELLALDKKRAKKAKPSPPPPKKKAKKPSPKARKGERPKVEEGRGQVSNMTILQLSNNEIEQLKEPAYLAQTFRITKKNLEWIKDNAYRLSKEMPRGKVSQSDILRLALKFFDNLLATNKEDLIKILKRIK